MTENVHIVKSEEETVALAREIVERRKGEKIVFALHGDLGAGKTRFAQGVALALGVKEPVCSPTFAIALAYTGDRGVRFTHIDLYRLSDEGAVEDFGFEEILAQSDVTAIEWPERAGRLLPPQTTHISFAFGATENERRITSSTAGSRRYFPHQVKIP